MRPTVVAVLTAELRSEGSEATKTEPKEKEPNMRVLDRLFSRRSRSVAAEPAPSSGAMLLMKTKPQLVSIDQVPFGSVLDFILECLETARGERVAFASLLLAYEAWCSRKNRRPYPDDEFAVQMNQLSYKCGIPHSEDENGRIYFVNVRLLPLPDVDGKRPQRLGPMGREKR